MKQSCRLLPALLFLLTVVSMNYSCNNSNGSATVKRLHGYPYDAIQSVLLYIDSHRTFPFKEKRVDEIKQTLRLPTPVLLCKDSLGSKQQLAQIIALNDPSFVQYIKSESQVPYRNEIFGVYPARESDFN